MAEVTYYGADWCRDCKRSRALMDGLAVAYDIKDVESSAEYTAEAEAISGRKNIPVIVFKDGEFLVEPTDPELREALAKRSLIS